jgi:peroxiredoxin
MDLTMTATVSSQEPAILEAGTPAPDFALLATPQQEVRLSELRGRPVILAFYPADWSPVCGDQMSLYNEMLDEFEAYGARLLGISVDSAWCHAAYVKDRGLNFQLLSDFEPKGAVSRRYGVYREQDGTSERALFVLDGNGVIRWSYRSPIDVNPGADGIINALESIASGAVEASSALRYERVQS